MAISIGGSVISTALSGLNAAEKRLSVSAQNVANATTENYNAKTTTQRTLGDGGVIIDIRSTNAGVSFDQEAVNQISAENDFKANLSVLKTQQELDKALFDITA